ncbi:hypothetical protein D3C81_1964890 [compost metagenome]
MANSVLCPISVGLIKQMHLSIQYNGPRRAYPFLFALLLGRNFTDLPPLLEVVASGHSDSPSGLLRIGDTRRHGII